MDRRLEQIVGEAIERPEDERAAFLDQECGEDAHLRREAESLVRAHEDAGEFLARPTQTDADRGRDGFLVTPGTAPEEPPGGTVGVYKLLQKIGEGGFGSVYMAEQREPVQRRVALKLIKAGMDTKQVIARFEAERQALAMMDHPNIARVLDAGTTTGEDAGTTPGRPYFVMELVKGIQITTFCDTDHLSIRQRLELFTDVCHAVQHAHQKGIVHRDIKPSNVLVTLHDEKAVPKVIDFGVAKATHARLTEKTLFTEFRQLIGTPAYMSPEQAQMSGIDIDTRSDIYSLGVLLYELLTGTTPFDSKTLLASGYDEMRRVIQEVEPEKPSTRVASGLRTGHAQSEPGARATGGTEPRASASGSPLPHGRGSDGVRVNDRSSSVIDIARRRQAEPAALRRLLDGDLDWIVMKCLEKDRTRRYETANGLAADIAHHLSGEPVLAAPPSKLYRMRKVVRRHRVPVAFAATIALLLIGATAVSLTLWQQSRANATRAEANAAATARQAEETELAATLLADIIGKTEPNEKHVPNEVLHERLDRFAASLEPKLAGHPEVEARVRLALGNAYRAIGELDRAEPHQARALAIYRELYGREHPKVAAALHDWAWLIYDKGDHAEGEATHREALAMRRRLLGNAHVDVAYSLDWLGDLLRRQRRFAESEAVLRESLAIVEKLYGPEHLEATGTLESLSYTLHEAGRFDKAEAVARRSLALNAKIFGAEAPRTVQMLAWLFRILGDAGRIDEAEAVARRSLALNAKIFGAEHPRTMETQIYLAEFLNRNGRAEEGLALAREGVEALERSHPEDSFTLAYGYHIFAEALQALGRPQEALAKYEAMLEMFQRLHKGDHRDTAVSLAHIAACLGDLGRPEEALTKFEAALAMEQRLEKGDHPNVAALLNNLANCFQSLNRPAEALPKYEASLEMYQRLYPGDHRHVALALHNLAQYLGSLNRPAEALPKFEAALDMNRRLCPGDHPNVATCLNSLGNCLRSLNRPAEALPKLEAALDMNRRLLPVGDARIANNLATLALVLLNQQEFAEAELLLRECLAIRNDKLPPEHWLRFNTMSMLGGALAGQAQDPALALGARIAKLEEAEPLLLDGYGGLKDNAAIPTEVRDQRIRAALERIVKLYETWDQAAPDAGYAEKAAEWRTRRNAHDETASSGPAP